MAFFEEDRKKKERRKVLAWFFLCLGAVVFAYSLKKEPESEEGSSLEDDLDQSQPLGEQAQLAQMGGSLGFNMGLRNSSLDFVKGGGRIFKMKDLSGKMSRMAKPGEKTPEEAQAEEEDWALEVQKLDLLVQQMREDEAGQQGYQDEMEGAEEEKGLKKGKKSQAPDMGSVALVREGPGLFEGKVGSTDQRESFLERTLGKSALSFFSWRKTATTRRGGFKGFKGIADGNSPQVQLAFSNAYSQAAYEEPNTNMATSLSDVPYSGRETSHDILTTAGDEEPVKVTQEGIQRTFLAEKAVERLEVVNQCGDVSADRYPKIQSAIDSIRSKEADIRRLQDWVNRSCSGWSRFWSAARRRSCNNTRNTINRLRAEINSLRGQISSWQSESQTACTGVQ